MSSVLLCTGCGRTLPEDASLCECDHEDRAYRLRARKLAATRELSPLSGFGQVLLTVVGLGPRTDDELRFAMLAASTAHREPAS